MKYLVVIFLILIIGVALIYLTAFYFFPKTSPKEISFELGEEEITEGKKEETEYIAPDFELKNIEGEKVKLSDFKNKIIILNFWTTWNPAAQDEIVILASYYQEIKNRGDLVLLTVDNQEDRSVAANFIRRGEYVLPVLFDEDGAVGELYKIGTLPATYFINQEGKVKEVFIGVLNKEEIKNKVEKLYIK